MKNRRLAVAWLILAGLLVLASLAPQWLIVAVFFVGCLAMAAYEWRRT